jgi:hypothetical protein
MAEQPGNTVQSFHVEALTLPYRPFGKYLADRTVY